MRLLSLFQSRRVCVTAKDIEDSLWEKENSSNPIWNSLYRTHPLHVVTVDESIVWMLDIKQDISYEWPTPEHISAKLVIWGVSGQMNPFSFWLWCPKVVKWKKVNWHL